MEGRLPSDTLRWRLRFAAARDRNSKDKAEEALINTVRAISRAEYEKAGAWGLSTQIDLYDCNPETLRSKERIEEFTHKVCDLLEVKRFGPTQIVRFGRNPAVYGYSMVQLIETSLVSAHFAEDSNAVYLDVFSCKYYDAERAIEFAKEFFEAKTTSMNTCIRN